MKILLSGASGFLGSVIFTYFKSQGHEVETIGRSSSNTLIGDLATYDTPLETKYDVVIHAAGKAHSVPKNAEEEKLFYDVNLEGTKRLLKNLRHSPRNFVFISTVAVYGKEYGIGLTEDSPLDANTPYGISKVLAEKEIIAWSSINSVATTILRLPLIIGANPKGNLKSMINAIEKGYYFNVGKGEAKKSVVLVDDVPLAINALMEHPGTYHLTDGYDPSFNELANSIGTRLGKKRILSLPKIILKPLAIAGDVLGMLTPLTPPINSNKLKKITKSLTFDDSNSKAVGWVSRPVLENQHLWLPKPKN